MNTPLFNLGTSTVPCGQRGDWTLEEFSVSESEAALHNISTLQPGRAHGRIRPGLYKRLAHRSRGVVMSNTPMEILTNREAYSQAKGAVLINGLGMGMLLEAVLAKPEVESVRVVEIDADVIALVGPHFAADPRVRSSTPMRSPTSRREGHASISSGTMCGTTSARATWRP